MNPIECKCWYTLSLLSLPAALITFSMSQFMELQFGNSKLVFSIVIVIMAVAFTTFVHKTEFFRSIMIPTNNHRFRWIIKAVFEFFILAFVTLLIVLMKYPRLRISDDKHEHRTISAIRAYCQNPNFPDPQIKDICSNLPKEKNSEHGDRMGFFSAAAFSLHIFSTSVLLNLPEEYGLFYMCLELTMNAAVEIPGIGASILNWYFVGPTSLYCFGLIIVRCYYHSSDEVRRRGRNGGDHDDDDGNDGDNRGGRPRQAVRGQQAGEFRLELPGMRNQQGYGDDGAEVGGGVGERKTGDQGHGMDPDGAGSGWEILSSKEGDESKAERDEGTSSDDGIERISSTQRIIMRKQQSTLQTLPQYIFATIITTIQLMGGSNRVICITCAMITGIKMWQVLWITHKGNRYGFRFVTDILRKLGLLLNRDSQDGAEGGGGGGRKMGDLGHSAGSDREIFRYSQIRGSCSLHFMVFLFLIFIYIDRFGDGTFWDSVGKVMLLLIGSLLGYLVSYFGSRFVTHILRQRGWVLNQEGDSHDGAKGGGGGSKTGDQGHGAGTGREIVSAEEADELKAEMADGTSSEYENEKISSTSNVIHERVITRRKQVVPSDQEKFPASKADSISDKKSAATGFNFFGKSLKSLSPGKQD